VDSRKKGNKGNQSPTVHLLVELVHVLTLPRHLSLKALNLFLVLANIHGEPGRHTLDLDLQVPLDVKLALEEGGLLLGIYMQKD
jgi:hypothetical protein